jgi:hypothetical protein
MVHRGTGRHGRVPPWAIVAIMIGGDVAGHGHVLLTTTVWIGTS